MSAKGLLILKNNQSLWFFYLNYKRPFIETCFYGWLISGREILWYKVNLESFLSPVICNKSSLSNLPAPMHRFYFIGCPSSAHALKTHSSHIQPTPWLATSLTFVWYSYNPTTWIVVPHPLTATRRLYIIILYIRRFHTCQCPAGLC